jgi:hypothetical protein
MTVTSTPRLDADNNKFLMPDEIMAALKKDTTLGVQLGLQGETSEEMTFDLGRVFREMDTDGNHKIDQDEFVTYFKAAETVTAFDQLTPRVVCQKFRYNTPVGHQN